MQIFKNLLYNVIIMWFVNFCRLRGRAGGLKSALVTLICREIHVGYDALNALKVWMVLIHWLVNIDARSPAWLVILQRAERRFAVFLSSGVKHSSHFLLFNRIQSVPILFLLLLHILLFLLLLLPLPPAQCGEVSPCQVRLWRELRLVVSVTTGLPGVVTPHSHRVANNLENIQWSLHIFVLGTHTLGPTHECQELKWYLTLVNGKVKPLLFR